MLTTVVFDVGETLVDESRMWRLWAGWLGVPEPVFFAVLGAVIERGEHHRRVFEILRPGFDLAEAVERRQIAGIPDAFAAGDLYPDAAPCLHELRRRGLRIGIAGNQPAGFENMLQESGVPFDFVASPEQWNAEKPSPLFFRKLADAAQAAPGSVAYVGDRLDNDILPALAAGMVAVFIRRGPWGYLHARRAEVAQAHLLIERLGELPEALERITGRDVSF